MAAVVLVFIHVHPDINLVLGAMILHGIPMSIWAVVPAQLPPTLFFVLLIFLVIVIHP
jgi:hypothetical protein